MRKSDFDQEKTTIVADTATTSHSNGPRESNNFNYSLKAGWMYTLPHTTFNVDLEGGYGGRTLVTRFNMAGLAIRIDIIHITTNRPAMFVLPGTVPLFALILFIKQVALEILHGIPPIFQIKTTGQLMPLIIKLMVETDTPLKICFMQVIIIATMS